MQLGMIGLGRMGGSMVQRLLRGGHACVVFDSESARVTSLTHEGAAGSHSLDEFVRGPRHSACRLVDASRCGGRQAHTAIDSSTPAPVLTAALFQRFSSRGEDDVLYRLLSAMRYQFGGHVERQADNSNLRAGKGAG
jgi:6-phosphogluconate dehydrogenase (decarboxylating)